MKPQGILPDRRFRALLVMLFVGLAIYLLLMLFPVGGARGLIITTNVAAVLFSQLTFWIFFSVWLSVDTGHISRRIWELLALGFFLWAVAEAIWAYYEVVLIVETPYPSFADFFWVLGYLPLYLGLTIRYKTLDITLEPRRKHTILMFIALLLQSIVYFVIRPMILEFDPRRMSESLLNVFYPSGDLALLILTSLIFFSMGKGRFALTWRFIISGFVIMSAADLGFSYLSWYSLYHPDGNTNLISTLVDFGFILSYALLSLGIYAYIRLLNLRREIRLSTSVDYGALTQSRILVFIDSKNRIISASANFMLLSGTPNQVQYEQNFFHDTVGINEEIVNRLVHTLKEKGSVSNYPLRIGKTGLKDVLFTAIALFSPQHEYYGAGIVLQADLAEHENNKFPLNEEQKALVESFLKTAGISANQEAQALKTYFLEQIRLIYSIVYEFNGQYVANGLLNFIAQKANEQGWNIQVDGHEISIPAEYDGQALSASLSKLLKAGRMYGANAVSLSFIDEEMAKIDRELKHDVLQIIDRSGVRIKNQPVY